MSKLIFSVLLAVCVLQSSLASPYQNSHSASSEENTRKLSREFGDSLKKLSTEIDHSINEIGKSLGWILNHAVSVLDNVIDEKLTSLTSFFVDVAMRIELYSIAGGSHYMFPVDKDAQVERDHRTTATVTVKMLTHLNTMERVDEILTNVTWKTIRPSSQNKENQMEVEELLRTFEHEWFKTLRQDLENDQTIRSEYQKWRDEVKKGLKSEPDVTGPVIKLWEDKDALMDFRIHRKLYDSEIIRIGIINKIFMKHAAKHLEMVFSEKHYKRYLLARAMIQMSLQPGKEEKINGIYKKALSLTSVAVQIKSKYEHASDKLFEYLEDAINKDSEVSNEISILKGKIASELTYDSGMLRVDLSLF